MSEIFGKGPQLPNRNSGAPAVPRPGFLRLFFRQGILYSQNDIADEQRITPPRVRYFNVVTAANGSWQADYTGQFSRVDFVQPVAIFDTQAVTNNMFASLHAYDNSAARGRVLNSNTLLLGGEGLQFSGQGVLVRVRVEGV